jgi:sec-independent protein translocase protein TatA
MPGGWEWLIIIAVLLLLFGAKRLPEMARSVGQSARVFKGEMKGLRDDEGHNTAQGAPQSGTRPAAPAEPAALPPVDSQINGTHPVNGTSQAGAHEQPTDSVRRDPVRPDTDR